MKKTEKIRLQYKGLKSTCFTPNKVYDVIAFEDDGSWVVKADTGEKLWVRAGFELFKDLTPFEQQIEDAMDGKIKIPVVTSGGVNVNWFHYQLGVHHFNLKLMAKGMTFRGINLTEIKRFYGLKGRSAKDCLPAFEEILENYTNSN